MTNDDIVTKISQINKEIIYRKCVIELTENYYNSGEYVAKGSKLVAFINDSKNIAFDKKNNIYEHFIIIKEVKEERFILSDDSKWVVDKKSGLEYSIYLLINEPHKFPDILGNPELKDLIESIH